MDLLLSITFITSLTKHRFVLALSFLGNVTDVIQCLGPESPGFISKHQILTNLDISRDVIENL